MAHFYRQTTYPVFEGLALANAVPPALNLCIFIFGLMLLQIARRNNPVPVATPEEAASSPQLQRDQLHFKRKDQARVAVLLGMILVLVILMPVVGGANALFVAFALAAVVGLVLHKFYDY